MMNEHDRHDEQVHLEAARILDSMGKVLDHIKSQASEYPNNIGGSALLPLNLKLDLKDFGPVTSGTVQLGPLTIFIGPNNSGKSYVSMLVHSIMSSINSTTAFIPSLDGDYEIPSMSQATKNGKSVIPPALINKLRRKILRGFEAEVGKKIEYNFEIEPHRLIRWGSDSARITVLGDHPVSITIGRKVTARSRGPGRITIKHADTFPAQLAREVGGETVLDMTADMRKYAPYFLEMYMRYHMLPPRPDTYHLPATRSGTLQSYKTLAANIVSAKTNLAMFSTGALAGTTRDFISSMITLPEKEGQLRKIGIQMEDDLLDGTIVMPKSGGSLQEITYSANGQRIPLHLASSTVSEVAPISICLRHIVKPGPLLIIEEPEAHLHPKNQARIARGIVSMIRAGLHVLITTHSPYLLERLGQYLVAGMLNPKSRSRRGYKDEYLLPDEVRPYVFSKTAGGYRILEVEKNKEDGISQEAFIPILEELNDESIRIHDNHE